MKTVFTTGQVATICKVANRTAAKWCDSGGLVHYRLPDSRDRRVTRTDLVAFLKKRGLPTHGLDEPPPVLLVGLTADQVGLLRGHLPGDRDVTLRTADGPFTAGLEMAGRSFAVVVVSLAVGWCAAEELARYCVERDGAVIALTGADDDPDQPNPGWFGDVFADPVDWAVVGSRVRAIVFPMTPTV